AWASPRPIPGPREGHARRFCHTGLSIEPVAQVRWIQDPFGNSIAIASFEGETRALELVSTICLERFGQPPDLAPIEAYAQKLPFSYLAEEAPDLGRYLERHYPDPNAMASNWSKRFLEGEGGPEPFATLERMCASMQQSMKYAMRSRPTTESPAI